MKRGPFKRRINGLTMYYILKGKKIDLIFNKEVDFFAIDLLLFLLLDDYTQKEKIKINNYYLKSLEDEDKIIETCIKNIKEENIITVFYKSEKDILYEISSIFFLSIPGYPFDYFKNRELDRWDEGE